MSAGRLIAVVGPSGVGKDSVIAGIVASGDRFVRVKRTITRPPGLGGEDYDAVTQDEFDQRVRDGAFCVHWTAHGLSYGIPAQVCDDVRKGTNRIANLSRSALSEAARVFPGMIVLNITARPETLARRLSGRGRESAPEIANRLAQASKPLPEGIDVIHLSNDGPLSETISNALGALQKVGVCS